MRQIQEITDKMTVEDFQSNSRLKPLYLLGYHHFSAYLYAGQKNPNEEENENENITE